MSALPHPEAEALLTGIDGPDPAPGAPAPLRSRHPRPSAGLATEAWRATTYGWTGRRRRLRGDRHRVGRWDSVGEVRGPTREAAAANLLADLRRRLAERVAGLQAVLGDRPGGKRQPPLEKKIAGVAIGGGGCDTWESRTKRDAGPAAMTLVTFVLPVVLLSGIGSTRPSPPRCTPPRTALTAR